MEAGWKGSNPCGVTKMYLKALQMKRLLLALTCRKYNLIHEHRHKFSYREENGRFQVTFGTRKYEVYNLMNHEVVLLRSPWGTIDEMHYWMAGIVNMLEYREIFSERHYVIAIA